jgi:16S rRNA (guanine966-N2)-methyltransferase
MKQTIRIIGGKFRGKKLHFPAIEGLRPTPDRVRETLFNWLMHDIHDARCLDAFAGSGALGFEAFSRGAANVTLLEKDPSVYAHLLKVTESFNTAQLSVQKTDACEFLQHTKERFNIVFLDPPFAKNYVPLCLEGLAHSNALVQGGFLYIESPKEIAVDQAIN